MKIYLGGKMSCPDHAGNWRQDIVTDDRVDGNFGSEYSDGAGVNLYAGCGAGEPPESWPTLPNAILGKHDYVGPYLVACDHGCFHSGDHAMSIEWGGENEEERKASRNSNRHQISKLCVNAMLNADILFFWFDGLDAYGTLAELVFISVLVGAKNKCDSLREKATIEKNIFVASSSFEAIDEMWLAFELIKNGTAITASTPKEALIKALELAEETTQYSPIEKKFIDKWRKVYGNAIVPQFNVPGFRYRVDFAFPDQKVAVELDGYEYHSSKEQFTGDRKRQREMELKGWRFIRFSGSEVYNNADACVHQAYEFWQSVAQAKA